MPALPINTSPDISSLDFAILYDISGPIPAITLTNESVGVPSGTIRLNQCTWWYVIATPSGTPVHTGSVTSPDVTDANWETLSITPYSWPTIFGNPPCGQIEFSCSVSYICTLYVKDSDGNIFSLSKNTSICRPNGNTSNTCGSFGGSSVYVEMKCSQGIVFCSNTTNYAYQSILTPSVQTSLWTLVYPPDNTGTPVANKTAENTPYVNFPIGYSAEGYVLYAASFATYDMGDGVTIKIQYKSVNKFDVLCDVDLCRLQCQIQKFYEQSRKRCGTIEDTTLTAKMTQINLLFSQALTGILQPLCGIKVPEIVRQIQNIGDFDPNCDCNCGAPGIGLSGPTGPGNGSGGCCPISVRVIDTATSNPPALCPGNYFPVQVKDPTAVTVIGTANNINDLIALLNAYPAWQAYGVAFAEGNCKVGWFVSNGSTPIDIPVTAINVAPLPPSLVTGNIVTFGTETPPAGCPSGNPYPQSVYNATGALVIGIANNIGELVSLLNADSTWEAYGVAKVQDTCHVQWNLTAPTNVPPSIQVITPSTACVGGKQFYTLSTSDICNGQPASYTFPVNAYVNFGLGTVSLGYVANVAALIAALNATPTKPATVTFSDNTSNVGVTIVKNSDCTAFSGTITIYTDAPERNYLLIGSNHGYMTASPTYGNFEQAIGLRTNSYIGKLPGQTEMLWHSITIGNYLISTDPYNGRILFYDVTNPLIPVLSKIVTLTTPGTTVFNGLPNSITMASGSTAIASRYSLYFPTDYQTMTLNEIYVVQALGGTIWKLNFFNAPGTEVVDAFQDAQLLGKCPRIIANNIIWFTQDGDLEQAAGLSSGIAEGSVIHLDLATFSAGGITVRTFFFTDEYIWAATFDGTVIHYAGNLGTLVQLTLSSNAAVVHRHAMFTQAFFRLNMRYWLGKLYISSLKFDPGVHDTGTIVIDAVTRAGTLFQSFAPGGTIPATSHYNFIPIGQCLGIVTFDNYTDSGHPQGGAALFSIPGGNFLSEIDVPVGNVYNLLAFPNIGTYLPTTFS